MTGSLSESCSNMANKGNTLAAALRLRPQNQLDSINIALIHKSHYNTRLEIFMPQVVLTTMYVRRLSCASWDVSIVRWHCFCHSAHSQNWFHSQHATFASLNHHSVTINVRLPASSCKNQSECSEKCGLLE